MDDLKKIRDSAKAGDVFSKLFLLQTLTAELSSPTRSKQIRLTPAKINRNNKTT